MCVVNITIIALQPHRTIIAIPQKTDPIIIPHIPIAGTKEAVLGATLSSTPVSPDAVAVH
jgi:hypothetical protein